MDAVDSVEPKKIADRDKYMTRKEAGEYLGVSESTLLRFESTDRLTPYREVDGGKRARIVYRESDVIELRKHPGNESEAEMLLAPAEMLKHAARAMSDSQAHVNKMMAPVMAMQEMLLQKAANQIEKLHERCQALETEMFGFIDLQKRTLRDDSDLRMDELRATEGAKMKREAFDRVVGYGPLIMNLLGDRYGNDATKKTIRESALINLVERMDDDQVARLQQSGALDQSSMATIINMKQHLVEERIKRLQKEEGIDSEASAADAIDDAPKIAANGG